MQSTSNNTSTSSPVKCNVPGMPFSNYYNTCKMNQMNNIQSASKEDIITYRKIGEKLMDIMLIKVMSENQPM
jgi:hypothetical protein